MGIRMQIKLTDQFIVVGIEFELRSMAPVGLALMGGIPFVVWQLLLHEI